MLPLGLLALMQLLRQADDGDPSAVLARLRTAQEAMNDMAAVLENNGFGVDGWGYDRGAM